MALRSAIVRQQWAAFSHRSHYRTVGNLQGSSYPKNWLPISARRHFGASSDDNDFSNRNQSTRHGGILVHPDSIANEILPGNIVMKKTRNGAVKKRYTELVYGYFWMIKDLKKTNEKPLQTTIIPEKQAKALPALENVKTLSGQDVLLPEYLLRRNKSNDPNAQSTLLAISFRDFGYQQLPSWIEPFQKEFSNNKDRIQVCKLIVSEGWFTRYILRFAVQASVKANTAAEDYDHTLLHFASDSVDFRDPLRMHNLLSGYVFLLDGLGRVRFAGSGQASEDDVDKLIQLTRELTPLQQDRSILSKPVKRKR